MDYHLTPEQIDLQLMVRDFVNKELIPVAAEYDRRSEFPMDVYKKTVDMGINCLDLPEEYGGAGVDYMTTALIREEISRGDAGFGSSLGANGLGFKPVAMAGTEEQKRMYGDVIAGGGFLALGLTEPNAGSDVANNKATAVKMGDEYILNGTKCFITNAPLADIITIFAITDKTAGTKGFSMFAVPKDAPGLSIGKHEDKLGIRTSATADVIMEDVKIPAKYLIGKEGDGFKIVMKTLDKGRVNAGASALGVARAALEYSAKYAQERVTMGKAICEHEMIQEMLADMSTQLEAGRQLVWRAALALDADVKEIGKLGAMCKLFAGDMVVRVCDMALQIHGGYGYSREYPIEKLYRDAKIFQIFEGTNQIQRTIISKYVVADHKIATR